jgi:hypothetical protein
MIQGILAFGVFLSNGLVDGVDIRPQEQMLLPLVIGMSGQSFNCFRDYPEAEA